MPRAGARMKATVDKNVETTKTMLANYAHEMVAAQPVVIATETADDQLVETERSLHQSARETTTTAAPTTTTQQQQTTSQQQQTTTTQQQQPY